MKYWSERSDPEACLKTECVFRTQEAKCDVPQKLVCLTCDVGEILGKTVCGHHCHFFCLQEDYTCGLQGEDKIGEHNCTKCHSDFELYTPTPDCGYDRKGDQSEGVCRHCQSWRRQLWKSRSAWRQGGSCQAQVSSLWVAGTGHQVL